MLLIASLATRKLKKKNIDQWMRNLRRNGGRRISNEFEEQVTSELILFNLNGGNKGVLGEESGREILANVIYSYACVRRAAKQVYNREERWHVDPCVMGRKFSDKWVQGFLHRLKLRKRSATAIIKTRPSIESVRAQMTVIQQFYETNIQTPDRVFNADETGINWAPRLKHQYIPSNAIRAQTPGGDESGRFTALLGSNGEGKMLPDFRIVKRSCKTTEDLSTSTILSKNFGEDKYFKPNDGWRVR
jgi:hypothetical protein